MPFKLKGKEQAQTKRGSPHVPTGLSGNEIQLCLETSMTLSKQDRDTDLKPFKSWRLNYKIGQDQEYRHLSCAF